MLCIKCRSRPQSEFELSLHQETTSRIFSFLEIKTEKIFSPKMLGKTILTASKPMIYHRYKEKCDKLTKKF